MDRCCSSAPSEVPRIGGRGLVRLLTGDFLGIEGRWVEVQVDVSHRGKPRFEIVGLAGKAIRESRERVRVALRNSGLPFPHLQAVLVNLAPTSERKDGSGFDLAVALGILLAAGHISFHGVDRDAVPPLHRFGLLGELGLDGGLRPVRGALLVADALRRRGVERIVVPPGNAREASLVRGLRVHPVEDLHAAIAALRGEAAPRASLDDAGSGPVARPDPDDRPDFSEVRGQEATKRALLVAAAGAHNVCLSGPPGVGKTMLLRRLAGILPRLSHEHAMEVTRIASACGTSPVEGLVDVPPFRAPHHTISYAGLVGGGSRIQPGEISRAHCGVLFLDEFPEFGRRALEALREPLEEGRITITRGSGSLTLPARFLLAAAMNPCPCGFLGHPTRPCRCGARQVEAYRSRITGPLLDRFDMFLDVGPVPSGELLTPPRSSGDGRVELLEGTASLARKVLAARALQDRRWGESVTNSRVSLQRLLREGDVLPGTLARLRDGAERWGLSARGFVRCLRVARTIGDLAGAASVEWSHLSEALHYRPRWDGRTASGAT